MTLQGALTDLKNLLNADDIPYYHKPSIKKIIETIEQEPQTTTITQQITESNQQITKSLQDSLKAGGNNATMLNYELSAIDRRLADISVTLAMIVDRLGGEG